jgi:capsular polysaccharide transport system permease protein
MPTGPGELTFPPEESAFSVIRTRARIVYALMQREVRSRSPGSRLGYLLDLAQPCLQLGMMYVVFWGIQRRADFGNSLFLFLLSGVVPYFLFTHTAAKVMGTVSRIRVMRPLGVVIAIDVAIALTILELISITLLCVGGLTIAALLRVPGAMPYDPFQMVLGLFITALTGMGVGLCNSYIAQFFPSWRVIWTVIARSLIFLSNVFYVIDFLPKLAREILWWNPLLHGVIWFRIGMFPHYPTMTFSPGYLIAWCLGSLLMALVFERVVPLEAA